MLNNEQIIPWAAGLFEGEGTISISKRGIRVAVTMTDLDVLETFQNNFGGSLLKQKLRAEHYKQQWRWTLTNNKETFDFIEKILPYLHSRRAARANEAILWFKDFVQRKKEKSDRVIEMRQKIKELGKSKLTHLDIAIMLDIDRTTVTHILNGKYD
jgi:hypothetical protein